MVEKMRAQIVELVARYALALRRSDMHIEEWTNYWRHIG